MNENTSESNVLYLFHRGSFIRGEDINGIVLHNLMGYKLNQQKNGLIFSGFPQTAIEKVAAKLEEAHISYKIVWEGHPEHQDGIFKTVEYPDNRWAEYSKLRDGDSPVIIERKVKEKANHKQWSEEDQNAYRYLCWMCETARQEGAKCTIELTEDIGNKLEVLKGMLEGRK